MLTISTLLYIAYWFVYNSIKWSLPEYLRLSYVCTHYAFLVLLPVTGWMGESWLGRYRTLVAGLVMGTATLLLLQISFVILNFNVILAFILAIVSLAFGACGIGGLYTNTLPFTLDQMIGAPAEKLSAAVQWYWWGFNLGLLIEDIFKCITFSLHFADMFPVIMLTLGSLCFSVVLVIDCLCHKQLDTQDKTGKPIKLIFEVLNYARKNKYPRLRSAFTYIDEEQPSRLDFGKHKFGGPFTEEEVEDVKTVFRILPLLVAIIGPAFVTTEMYDQFGLHAIPTNTQTFMCAYEMKVNVYYISTFVLIPFHRFIVYPLFNRYIPSLLKIIGGGIFLCLVSTVVKLLVESIGHFYSKASYCILDNNTATGTLPIPLYWVLIVEFMSGVGASLAICFLFEFVMAQTPNRMRGIIMGLVLTLFGFGKLGMVVLTKLASFFRTSSPSCVFYYYLLLSLLMLLILVVYVVLARQYKLRERERHINIHAIVEEHYERYFEQEEEYMKETHVYDNHYY